METTLQKILWHAKGNHLGLLIVFSKKVLSFTQTDKLNDNDSNSPSPKSTERIIIGHEKSGSHAERRSEMSAQLVKKYEGKSREVCIRTHHNFNILSYSLFFYSCI